MTEAESLDAFRETALKAAGLSPQWASRIRGEDTGSIEADIRALRNLLDAKHASQSEGATMNRLIRGRR